MTLQNDRLALHLPVTLRDRLKGAYIGLREAVAGPLLFVPGIHFLYGHFLFADEQANFRRIMGHIQRYTDIISYTEAVQRLQAGRIDRPYVCFSFDDGIKNTARIASYFHERGLSALFFVNPAVVENAHNPAYTATHSVGRLNKKPLDFFDWRDIETLLAQGHEIGNHGLRHQRLSTLAADALTEEIGSAQEILSARTGVKNLHYAWPYGMAPDVTQAAIAYVRRTGHVSVCSAMRGLHTAQEDVTTHFILRDQLVFGEPMGFYDFFYRQAQRTHPDTAILRLP